MNNISTWRVVCTFRRALWFSFVTAPALFFFVGFVFLSFNNSLAGEFMEEARSLVADAPPGKVWGCVPPHNTPTDDSFPPVPTVKPVCERVLVDADTWRRSTDSFIRQAYLLLVILGAFVWWFCNGLTESVVIAYWLKDKVGKILSLKRGER